MTLRWLALTWMFAPLLVFADSHPVLVDAVLDERQQPIYPRPAIRDNREGWVLVDFDVDSGGRVTNARVLDSVGGSQFELPAVNSVTRWGYTPAKLGERDVFQGRNLAYVVFAINTRSRGSTKRFADRYNDALDLIEKKELERANKVANTVFDDWPMNLHELTKLWSLRAQLALLQGDVLAAEVAMQRAMANNGEWLARPTHESMLLASVQIETETGQFGKAIQTFEKLLALKPRSTAALMQTKALIQTLRDTIDSNGTLATDGTIATLDSCNACEPRWSFIPVRKKFSVENVVGDLTAVNMICDGARVSRSLTSETEWQIPDQYRSCRIELSGSNGTQFRILQLPN